MGGERRDRRVSIPAAIVVVALFAVFARETRAARIGPDPMINQFVEGYGIIAAEVIEAKQVVSDPKRDYPARYDVTFRVREVVGQPIQGKPFPLEPGGSFVVQVSVGYGCALEDFWDMMPSKLGPLRPGGPLVAGTTYYVTAKFDPDKKTYTLAPGSGVLKAKESFTEDRRKDILALHALAAMTPADRVARCREILLDRTSRRFVRDAALAETSRRVHWTREADEAERRATVEVYWKIWRGDTSQWDDQSLGSLNFAMRDCIGDAFTKAPERRDLWLARMFAPLGRLNADELQLECIRRNNQLSWVIIEIGEIEPKAVGGRLMTEMRNDAWPTDLQTFALRCLLVLYGRVEALPEDWEPFLQKVLPKLIDGSASWPLRCIVANLTPASAVTNPSLQKRSFKPGPVTVEALKRALDRERRVREENPKAQNAVYDIEHCLKAIQ